MSSDLLAARAAEALLDREVRQLLYGRRRQMYRILYEIRGETVYVLRLRHAARAYLDPEEIG